MRSANPLATGLALPNACISSFTATQAAWRFYGNADVTLRQLVEPLVSLALERSRQACDAWVPVVLDWSNIHFEKHLKKADRTRLMHTNHQGYKLLTALAISDKNGVPLAPVCLELASARGLHSTRGGELLDVASVLDGLTPVMAEVVGFQWGKPVVFVIDREADSVAHYRAWDSAGWRFVIRADLERIVDHPWGEGGGGGRAIVYRASSISEEVKSHKVKS